MTRLFVSYLRVSTSRQGESGLGLEAQRASVARYLQSVDGVLLEEFQEVETGKGSNALAKRPRLRAALDMARGRKATLIVAKLDRLTRSARLLLELVEVAGAADLAFVDFPQIPTGPVGKFMITQLGAVAEFEAGMISQRTRAALAAAKERGVRLGAHGAKLAEVRKASALEYARSVERHFSNAREAGCSTFGAIADHLNAEGLPTREGGRWFPASVRRVTERLKAV